MDYSWQVYDHEKLGRDIPAELSVGLCILGDIEVQ